MVIKKIPSTKATKKKNSIRLWKTLYKKIKNLLKENNNSCDLLEMWTKREENNLRKAKKRMKQTSNSSALVKSRNKNINQQLHRMKIDSFNNESTAFEAISMVETLSQVIHIEDNQELECTSLGNKSPTNSQIEKINFSSNMIQALELNTTNSRPPLGPEIFIVSDTNNKNSNYFKLSQKKYFNPVQNNRIYPESNSSHTSVTSGFSKNSDFFEARRPISSVSSRKKSDNYIKNDLYPKFPSNPNKHNF